MIGSNSFPNAQITAAATAEAAAVQAVSEALRAACNDPADAVRLLSLLATYNPVGAYGADTIGSDMAAVEAATSSLCRRAALVSLALAAASYAPTSYQDAVTVRTNVCSLIDAEILIAGDAGDYDTYAALRTLRTAVSADLTSRAANIANVITFQLPTSLPSLVVAYALYQDASRSDDLVSRVDPRSPLFMPRVFDALAY